MGNDERLLKLAREKFGELTAIEKRLFRCVANGELANFSSKREEENDPANADKWGEDRRIEADRIVWLCTFAKNQEYITRMGIAIKGLLMNGAIDLSFIRVDFPLVFEKCRFIDDIRMFYCKVCYFSLAGSYLKSWIADGINVNGHVFIDKKAKSNGEIRLMSATITGDLVFSNSYFCNPEGVAISADKLDAGGTIFLMKDSLQKVKSDCPMQKSALICHAGMELS